MIRDLATTERTKYSRMFQLWGRNGISLSERLRALRCSAPFTTVLRSWPCKRLWEKTAIDCIAAGSERLHTEVFRTSSIEAVISKGEQFFGLMPKLCGHKSSS